MSVEAKFLFQTKNKCKMDFPVGSACKDHQWPFKKKSANKSSFSYNLTHTEPYGNGSIKNIQIGRKEVEDTDKIGDANTTIPFYGKNLYILNAKNGHEAKNLKTLRLNQTRIECPKQFSTVAPFAVASVLAVTKLLKEFWVTVD